MAGNYEIKKVSFNDQFAFLRVPEIEAEGTTIDVISRAVSIKLSTKFVKEVYLPKVTKSIYEVFMRLDLATLRAIDSNAEAQEEFINSRFPPNIAAENALDGKLMPIIFLMIDIKTGDKFEDRDIEYVNDILTWVSNKIYVVPILRFSDDINRDDRVKFYYDFVRKLLDEKESISDKIRSAISIPSFCKGSRVSEIFELYKKENKAPALAVIDFERNRITSSKIIGVVTNVVRAYNDAKEEKYAIYGFNVKPYKKGVETPPAEDMGCFLSGLNAIGDTYRLNNQAKVFVPEPKEIADLPKIFNSDAYKYLKLSDQSSGKEFSDWCNSVYGFELTKDHLTRYPRYEQRFNVFKTGVEAVGISEMINKGEEAELKKKIYNKDITKLLTGK